MPELTVKCTPADGSEPHTITLRIGDPVQEETCWSVLVEVLGGDRPYAMPIKGEDWAQALEIAAKILPVILEVESGGGTLEPEFYQRDTTLSAETRAAIREFGLTPPADELP